MSRGPVQDAAGAGRRRRWLLLLGAFVVLVVIGLWLRPPRLSPPDPEDRRPAVDVAIPVATASSAGPAAPSAGSPAPPAPPNDPIADYRARTRLSPSSGALHPEAVDLLEPNRRYESLRPIEDTAGRRPEERWSYLFDADHYYYAGDDPVKATLEVRHGGELAPVRITRARAVAETAEDGDGEEEPLTLRRRDGRYLIEVTPEDLFPEHHGPIQFLVEFEYEAGRRQEAALRLFSTPVAAIPARFTRYRSDTLRDGSLVVDAGVEVRRPGFYRFDANLFSAEGAPLAFASYKGPLDAGRQRVPLEFFGLLMAEIGVPGPYELRNLRGYLFLDGEYPDRLRMRDAEESYWTRAYEVGGFSREEFTSPHKERMLELLEQDVQSGAGVDMPEPATQ